tara:strand:- start:11444 stop:11974 length:531 start_codon:yes stop_codon:yes gene_type:complete
MASSSRLLSSRPELGSRHRRGDDATILAAVEGKEKNRRRLQNGRHDTHRVLADFNVQTTRGGALFFVSALFLVVVFAVIFHGGDSTIAESEVREQNADGGRRTQRRLLAESSSRGEIISILESEMPPPRLFIPFLSLLARAIRDFLTIPAFRETHHVSLDFFAPKLQKTTFITGRG